jgi:hypothetical protein
MNKETTWECTNDEGRSLRVESECFLYPRYMQNTTDTRT